MSLSKTYKIIIVSAWVILSMYYYTVFYGNYTDGNKYIQYYYNFSENDNFLIYTPGCKIPNYLKTIQFNETKHRKNTCGQRAVYVKKHSEDEIQFITDDKKMHIYLGKAKDYNCCFKFVGPGTVSGKINYGKLRYSPCIYFKNGTISQQKEEVITVTCFKKATKTILYEDAYIIIKKINKPILSEKNRWNILMIGMDTMSRARVSISMPKTMNYLKQQEWLDFRGYTKVGSNTFPNLAAFLTGKEISVVNEACASGLDKCNDLFLWSDFQENGYTTAYGEDFVQLPDTFTKFHGYKNKPTDHYMRQLFLTSERNLGNIVCTQKLTSTEHILDYASNFSNTYKNDSFFGLFWINSNSHNPNNNPSLVDDNIIKFFENLKNTDVMENSFIFFLSDHGIRFGQMRVKYESYFDERLPMFFLWVPEKFRELHPTAYENLQNNQNRLTSPYDLYITMWDIYKTSNTSVEVKNSEACPRCRSLLSDISPHRTCDEAGVSDKWCSCHEMDRVQQTDKSVQRSVQTLVDYLQNKSKLIQTIQCTECEVLQVKTIYRVHTYKYNNMTHYVIAIVMSAANVAFETTVVEYNDTFNILQPTYTISQYNTRGQCVVNPIDRPYCVCKHISNCKKKT